MDEQQWLEYVQKVATGSVPIPASMISNYEDWHCRSIVGRVLFIMKDIEGAMTVLATTRDIVPDMEQHPEYGLSDCEHKVLCLRDLAEIIWLITGTADAPMQYLQQADKLAREYKYVFRSADRGKLWVRQLELKRSCGLEMEAMQEAVALIKEKHGESGVNPYLFHAFKFIAEDAAERQQYAQAVALLQEAYKYFPLSPAGERDIAEALAEATAEKQYELLYHCTTLQYRPWEADDVPTLEEFRKMQMDKYYARKAKEAAEEAAAKEAGEASAKEEETPEQLMSKIKL